MCFEICSVRVLNFFSFCQYCARLSLSHTLKYYKFNYRNIKICTYIERFNKKRPKKQSTSLLAPFENLSLLWRRHHHR